MNPIEAADADSIYVEHASADRKDAGFHRAWIAEKGSALGTGQRIEAEHDMRRLRHYGYAARTIQVSSDEVCVHDCTSVGVIFPDCVIA